MQEDTHIKYLCAMILTYLSKWLSPLDDIMMALFDTTEDKQHQCKLNNIYNLVAFCKAAYNHKNKLLTHGVTRKVMRGILPYVTQ